MVCRQAVRQAWHQLQLTQLCHVQVSKAAPDVSIQLHMYVPTGIWAGGVCAMHVLTLYAHALLHSPLHVLYHRTGCMPGCGDPAACTSAEDGLLS